MSRSFCAACGREFTVRELGQQVAALVVGAEGVRGVAVALIHQLKLHVADLLLGLGRFFHLRIEQNEVLVLRLGLREAVRAAFAEPAIGHQQLGLRQILAGVVGVHQRLQRETRALVAAVLHVIHGAVEQHLVGLLRVLGDGIVVLLLAASNANQQQRHRGEDPRITNCFLNHVLIPFQMNFRGVSPKPPSTNHRVRAGRDLLHFAHRRFRIATVKDGRPCDYPITPRANHFGQVIQMYPAIDLYRQLQTPLPSHLVQFPDLFEHIRNQLLPAKPRINAHEEHVIRHFQNVFQHGNRRGGVQHHACHCALFLDTLERSIEMPRGFVVYQNRIRSRMNEISHITLRVLDHQVDIEVRFRRLCVPIPLPAARW